MNFLEFQDKFPTQKSIIDYFIQIRYNHGVKLQEYMNGELNTLKEELRYTKIISNYRANQLYQSIDNNIVGIVGEIERAFGGKESDEEKKYFREYLDREPIARTDQQKKDLVGIYTVYK